MKPILYPKNATKSQITSSNNGIGRLSDAISVVVFEELNGQYELEMLYPVSGAHFEDLGIGSVIVCLHEDSDDLQPFEVYSIKKASGGKAEIYAHHITYRLNNFVVMPFSVSSSADACSNVMQGLKNHAAASEDVADYTFQTDVHTNGNYNQGLPASIRSRLGGVEGSVLDQFGGEYEWDKFTVKLHYQRGRAITGITLKYGKNITDIEQETILSNVITGVVPFWTKPDGDSTLYMELPEKVVYSQYANNYPYHLTVPLDLSDQWDNQPSAATLRSAAQAFVNKSSLGVPKVSIKVSFVSLWQTEEYKDIAPLERVCMGDTIEVYFESLDIEAQARVVATEYNVLLERYNEIQIGSIRSTLAQTLNDQRAATIQTIDDVRREAKQDASSAENSAKSYAQSYANQAVNNATRWLTTAGGYVIAIKNSDGSWKELIFASSTNLEASNTQILRINNNGIGFSSTGIDGPYTNAWTIDGHLNASFIYGGTLTLGGLDNINGSLKIIDESGTIGSWTKNGINVKKGSISGTSFVINSNNVEVFKISAAGVLLIKDSDGNEIFKVDPSGANNGYLLVKDDNGGTKFRVRKQGLTWNADNSSMTEAGKLTATGADINGKITADSGAIGGFTIDSTSVRSGDKNATSAGAVTLANANFSRLINGTNRSNLRLAIGSKFGVKSDGTIYASGTDMSGGAITGGTITGAKIKSENGGSYVQMNGGKIYIYNKGSGGAYIEIERSDGVHVWLHEDKVSFNNGDAHMEADWEDIIEAANNR